MDVLAALQEANPAQRAELDRVIAAPRVPSFREWLPLVTPAYDWTARHLVYLQDKLEAVYAGDLRRLMVFMPPRHGKSEMTTVRFSAYWLLHRPDTHVMVGAYNQHLASKFSRKIRKLVRTQGLVLSGEIQRADEWETVQEGGLLARGMEAGVTGFGGDLLIIDDPIKGRKEAESATVRDGAWAGYVDDFESRLHPGARIIVINTRWHFDDVSGRILERAQATGEHWEVVSFPAEATEHDVLGRSRGDWLWPERFPPDEYAMIKSNRTGYSWAALYQQTPIATDDCMFPRDKVELVDAVPRKGMVTLRYWDKAGSEDSGDWTAGCHLGRSADGVYYVLDMTRQRAKALERRDTMRNVAIQDAAEWENVVVWTEQEPGSGGKESAEQTVRDLAGFRVYIDKVTGDKTVRAEPFAAQWQNGNVKLLRGPWNKAYLDEMETFPAGKHDDQADASAGAFNKLTPHVVAGLSGLGGLGQTSYWTGH